MPTRLCNEPRCPNPVKPGKSKCIDHYRAYERDRSARRRHSGEKSADAIKLYHSAKWLNTRRAVLLRDPICKACDNRLSTEVDHIKPLSQGGDPYSLANLRGICNPCHAAKSAQESRQAIIERQQTDNG